MLDETFGFASSRGDNFVFHDNDALMSKHDVTQTADCMRLCGWTKTTYSACIYLGAGKTGSYSYTFEI
jgi:hypothetical protein